MTKTNDLAEAITMERTYDAPVGRVWTALTDVNEMRRWYFDIKEFQPKIGCEFEFVVEHEGNTYHHLCKVTAVILQKKIAYRPVEGFGLFKIGEMPRAIEFDQLRTRHGAIDLLDARKGRVLCAADQQRWVGDPGKPRPQVIV